ncbi:peptidase M29 [Paraburkholderia susongensis]|uniref:2,5-dihydroxypyridine 5,6-dioxygenase n=1 Tax=Paraburkholderia susongensis TaxID=1515439 RepID=A0A1X7LHK0_9BURK|nr:peptidase M29 [Paraburkholderia susongensis]SMG52974.1 2,5-dihydroxypyridine 5,6-dioxygenase [Paraburkholderia susongensis]
MHRSGVESKWIRSFAQQFSACGVGPRTVAAILCETGSRTENVVASRHALAELGASQFLVEVPTPVQSERVPVRSTGASDAVQGLRGVIAALSHADIVIDCTVEGMLHAKELGQILVGGTRLMMVSNEHPEILERIGVDPGLERRVKAGVSRLRRAREMHVTSAAGTDLRIAIAGCPLGGNWGYCTEPGTRSHWPGGLIAAFPTAGSVNGTLIFAPGDANLTFKRYFESHVSVRIEQDYITAIEGDGLDGELLRSYIAAWGDREAYAVSHVGWGMNERARWDSMVMYDKNDFNGTELRVFAGNFLFSTGANEHAGRFTKGHFDLPMRNCTIALDGEVIVDKGVLKGELASSEN